MTHTHRWKLETPTGEPMVRGVCVCGAERDFPASAPDLQDWAQRKRETWNHRVSQKPELHVY